MCLRDTKVPSTPSNRAYYSVELLLYIQLKDMELKELQDLGIDKIWHVGIRVHSKEFYFGKSGICVATADDSHGIIPDKVVEWGKTHKTFEEIMAHIRSDDMSKFQAKYYDTIDNNCMAFANYFTFWVCGRPPPSFCYDFYQASKLSGEIENYARANDRSGFFAMQPHLVIKRNSVGARGIPLELDTKEREENGGSKHLLGSMSARPGEVEARNPPSQGTSSSSNSIYITGYSLRAPKSNNAAEFYTNLATKNDMVDVPLRYPKGYLGLPNRAGHLPYIEHFDNQFFCMNPKQVDKTEVGLRLSLECVQEAIMDAMISISDIRGSATGVYVGCCETDFATRAQYDNNRLGYEMVNGAKSMMANRISYFYDLKGPSLVLDTACSSSLVALDIAREDILSGKIDRAIVVGANLTLDPHKNACFNAFKMLSPDGTCHAFDDRANGYCRSEGIFAIVLEAGSVCLRGGYAKLLGTAVNSDGHKTNGITFPSGSSQCENARKAFEQSGISPSDVTYVEAHGTGTTAGDSEELSGFFDLFYCSDVGDSARPPRSLPIGSVKSCMGHAEGASGLASVIKCLLMMEKRQLLPNLHFKSTSHRPILNHYFEVVTEVEPWEPGCVCVSNYGFGGTNAFAILAPGNAAYNAENLDVSSFTGDPSSLSFGNQLKTSPGNDSPNKCSGQTHRWFQEQVRLGNEMGFRFRNENELSYPTSPFDTIAFVFGGQGGQWLNMGKRLYKESDIFFATIFRLDCCVSELLKDFAEIIDIPLSRERGMCLSTRLAALYQTGDQWLLKDFAALGVISYQIAIVNIMQDIGVRPDFVLGHSMGEVTAAYAAGVQSEKETIGVALTRSLIVSKMGGENILKSATVRTTLKTSELPFLSSGENQFQYYRVPSGKEVTVNPEQDECVFDLRGKMAAVGKDASTINTHIDKLDLRQTCVACFNSPRGQTVSGPEMEVNKLFETMSMMYSDLSWRNLNTDGLAFHSPLWESQEGLIDLLLRKVFKNGILRTWQSKWLSTSERDPCNYYNMAEFDIVKYHMNNITHPVYFQSAIEALPENCLVIEVGSSQSLLSQVKRVQRGGIGVLGFIKNNSPSTEDIFSGSPDLKVRRAMWEAGFGSGRDVTIKSEDDTLRLSVDKRYPNLWDHTTSHRIFTWEDYAQMEADGKAKLESSTSMALIDEVLQSTADQLLCKSSLSTSSHVWIKDHKVDDMVIFPGVGYLEMVFQASRIQSPGDVEMVHKVYEAQIKMLFLSNDDTVVYTELKRSQEDSRVFSAFIYTLQEGKKNVHFSCKINYSDAFTDKDLPSSWLADQGMPTETSRLNRSQIYNELLGSMNYSYGETFQLLEYVESSEVHARGKLDASSVTEGEVGTYCIHPCVLDDALHTIFPLLKTFTKSFVPVQFNEVVILQAKPDPVSHLQVDAELLEVGPAFQYYVAHVQIKGLITLKLTFKPLEQAQSDHHLFERVLVPAQIPIPTKPWEGWQNILKENSILFSRAIITHMQDYVKNAFSTAEAKELLAREETLSLHVRRMIALAREGLDILQDSTGPALSPSELAEVMPLDLEMADRVGLNLVRIWQNPRVAQEVLFNDDLMTNIYKDGSLFQEREAMRAKLAIYKDIKGLRVLEVGGGTGGLTEIALEVLDDSTDYVFSDISPSFLSRARERWGDRITCQVVDLGGDQSAFDETPYDLIIGFDVVHATSNIERTMQNMKDMLAPGGSMVIMDFVDVPWWAEMCFGVFEGWFLFEDNHRSRTCYLDQPSWQNLSECMGFDRFSIEHHGFHCVLGFGKHIEKKTDFDCNIKNSDQLINYLEQFGDSEATKERHTLRLSASSREENALLVGFIRSVREEYPTHVFETYIADVNYPDLEVTPSGNLAKERYIKFEPRNHRLENHPNGASFKNSFDTRMLLPPTSHELGENEVQIRILFSSLNFRDVATDLKLIDLSRDGAGFELFGEIMDSGDPRFNRGDEIVGFAVHNFATSLCVVDSSTLVKVRDNDLEHLSPKQMVANLVYITAFAMKKVSNLSENDTVLIHSATGGFGLSCVHLCKRIGCTIVATAGTKEKRKYLREKLQIQHVFDSRGDWFAELCSSPLLGEGSIDVVVNSLAGNENIRNGVLALAPFGHLCEVGKRDVYHNPMFDRSVLKLRPNVSMHYIDVGHAIMGNCFESTEERRSFVEDLFAQNEWITFDPLPIQEIFPVSALSEAVETMAKGVHIGRFLLDHTIEAPPKPITSVAPQYPRNGKYVITGGLGGLGIALVEYLCKKAHAASVTLLSRRGETTVTQDLRLKSLGERISIFKCDVTRKEDLESLILCEVHAVFHLAKVLVDKPAIKLSTTDLASVYDPKIKGLKNLHERFPSSKHIVFSSAAGILGNFHQAAYSAASQWVEEFVRNHTNIHLLNVGTVNDVGEIAETPGLYAKMKRKQIMSDIQSSDVFESIDWLLASEVGQLVMLAPSNYQQLRKEGRISERYENVTHADESNMSRTSMPDAIAAIVKEELNLKRFDSALKLTSYGLDSLSSVVLVKKFNNVGIKTSSMELLQGISADELVLKAESYSG